MLVRNLLKNGKIAVEIEVNKGYRIEGGGIIVPDASSSSSSSPSSSTLLFNGGLPILLGEMNLFRQYWRFFAIFLLGLLAMLSNVFFTAQERIAWKEKAEQTGIKGRLMQEDEGKKSVLRREQIKKQLELQLEEEEAATTTAIESEKK